MVRKFILVVLAALVYLPALASVDEVRLHVQGLACPFCVFGIEKNLKRVPGVTSLETTIRDGLVRIQMDPGAALDVKALNEAVLQSGFTPAGIRASITGRLVEHDGRSALESSGSGQVFLLLEAATGDTLEPLSQDKLRKVRTAAGVSGGVTISGGVHGHRGMPSALTVDRFEAAP